MSGTVYLVRHGRTALNAEGRFRGRLDPPLDDHGFAEAARAAGELKELGLVAVYTSPLLRAVQTAEFVAAAARARVLVEPGLVDLDHGAWEGLTPGQAEARDPDAFCLFRCDPLAAQPPEGERLVDVERRIVDSLVRVSEGHGGDPVAATSHEIPIRLVLSAAAGLEPRRAMWDLDLPTGAVRAIRVQGRVPRLVDD
jgi:broad specificity phosphatase PhoE